MKSILILLLALTLSNNVMAQDPSTPAPVLPSEGETAGQTSPNSPNDKALVDQDHKPVSAFEGHSDQMKKTSKKTKKQSSKKTKMKKIKMKKSISRKMRKNKKPQA